MCLFKFEIIKTQHWTLFQHEEGQKDMSLLLEVDLIIDN